MNSRAVSTTTVPDFSIHDGKNRKPRPNSLYSWGNNDLRFRPRYHQHGRHAQLQRPHSACFFTADSFLYWVTLTNAGLSHDQHPTAKPARVPRRPRQRTITSASHAGNALAGGATGLAAVRALGDVELPAAGVPCSRWWPRFMERSMPSPLQLSQFAEHRHPRPATPAAIVVTTYTAFRLHNLNLWLVYLIVLTDSS